MKSSALEISKVNRGGMKPIFQINTLNVAENKITPKLPHRLFKTTAN